MKFFTIVHHGVWNHVLWVMRAILLNYQISQIFLLFIPWSIFLLLLCWGWSYDIIFPFCSGGILNQSLLVFDVVRHRRVSLGLLHHLLLHFKLLLTGTAGKSSLSRTKQIHWRAIKHQFIFVIFGVGSLPSNDRSHSGHFFLKLCKSLLALLHLWRVIELPLLMSVRILGHLGLRATSLRDWRPLGKVLK